MHDLKRRTRPQRRTPEVRARARRAAATTTRSTQAQFLNIVPIILLSFIHMLYSLVFPANPAFFSCGRRAHMEVAELWAWRGGWAERQRETHQLATDERRGWPAHCDCVGDDLPPSNHGRRNVVELAVRQLSGDVRIADSRPVAAPRGRVGGVAGRMSYVGACRRRCAVRALTLRAAPWCHSVCPSQQQQTFQMT